jgi:antitoxin CcdA
LSHPASERAKRAVNVCVSTDLLDAGRRARVNLSALLERALTEELALLKRFKWLEENALAIAAYNVHVEQSGTFYGGTRSSS